jgi:hypothetical protein
MPNAPFVVEKLAWYINRDLRHDPRVKLKTLALFLQDNGLTTRQLIDGNDELKDTFQITSDDLTERGLRFIKSGYQKWIKSVDRGSDPNDPAFLQRAISKLAD